jgi:subfamily B ATP-binding cassette protein HlyB/CyaB
MADTVGDHATADTGLQSLSLLLRFHGIAADAAQISHRFGGAPIGVTEMLRCAKEFKFKARAVTTHWTRLNRLPLPVIAAQRDGTFIILAKVTDEQALIHAPSIGRPQLVGRAEFEAGWSGRLVLIARRASLGELARHFDVTWFLQAMAKYRRILGEVLVASFFLQLFALVTPLFFQVVTDKVLVHRGYTMLDVLIIGLLAVSGIRDGAWSVAHLCVRPYHESHRRGARRAAVSASCRAACCLLRGAACRRLGSARARA